jgi:hypothetical protein
VVNAFGTKNGVKKASMMIKMGLLSSLIVATSVAPSFAGYTAVRQPPAGENNHAGIFGDIYGGTFVGQGVSLGYSMWTRYSNNAVTAYRIDDFNEGGTPALNILTGEVGETTDQIWTGGISIITAEVKGKYAVFNQSFGHNGGGLGTDYEQLLTAVGQSIDFSIGGDFLWGIQPDGFEWWSLVSANDERCPYDHMVTYKIEGLETNHTVWMLFFEDLPSTRTDKDYNDFFVEVRAVPEPATIVLLGMGASIIVTRRKRFV